MPRKRFARSVEPELLTAAQFLALPAQADGTVARVQLDAAAGVIATFRLNKASANAAKWECEGITPGGLFAKNSAAAAITIAAGVWGDIDAGPPSITVPLTGDWDVWWGAHHSSNVNGASLYTTVVTTNGTPATTNQTGFSIWITTFAGPAGATLESSDRIAGTAGGFIKMQYEWATANSPAGQFSWRWLRIAPARVVGPAAL